MRHCGGFKDCRLALELGYIILSATVIESAFICNQNFVEGIIWP